MSRDPVPALAPLGEALRNWRTGGSRTIGMVALIATLLTLASTLELSTTDRIVDQATELQQAGRYVVRVGLVDSEGAMQPISAAECQDLAGAWKKASGVALRQGQAHLAASPGFAFAAVAVDSGALTVIAPSGVFPFGSPTPGNFEGMALAGSQLTRELALGMATLADIEGSGTTLLVPSFSIRSTPFDRSLLVPRNDLATGDECWIEFEPAMFDAGMTAVGASFKTTDANVLTTSLRISDEFSFDPVSEYQERPTRYLYAGVVVVLLLATGLQLRSRRSDIGLYTTLFPSRAVVALVFWGEQAISGVLGGASAAIVVAWYGVHGLDASAQTLAVAIRSLCLALLLFIAAALAQTLFRRHEPAIDLLKDR